MMKSLMTVFPQAQQDLQQFPPRARSDMVCWACRKPGHMQKDCPMLAAREGKAQGGASGDPSHPPSAQESAKKN